MVRFTAAHLLYLLEAARWTVVLSLCAFVSGAMLGLMLALARVASARFLSMPAAAYIHVMQGMPLLILLFLSYYGLSMAGLRLDPFVAAVVSLTLYSGAFLGEIWRGCIQAVPRTQWEASDCLGLSRFQQYAYVILPQAATIATAPTVGFMVQIVKNTSLVSVIGFVEVSRAGQIVNNSAFEPFLVFTCVAGIYFALCYPLSLASRYFERRLQIAG